MPQLEYSDFYKFIVSVGIALIILAVLLPWLFLRESFDLMLDVQKLAHLTSEAQTIIGYRQHLLARIFHLVPWISGLTFSAGIFLGVIGLVQWRERQFLRDKSEELGLRKLERELTQMSAEQVNAKQQADIEQEHVASQPAELVSSTSLIRQIERDLQERMAVCFGTSYLVRANQRLGNAEYDVVLESRNAGQADVIVEIKYIRKGFQFGWMRESVSRLLLATDLYRERLQRNAIPLLLIITADSVKLPDLEFIEMRSRLTGQTANRANYRVERIWESEIKSISCDRLQRIILG